MIEYLRKQNWEFYFEWASTVVLVAGVTLTSFNVYPLNVWVSLIGNAGWLVLGYLWRKWSVVAVSLIIVAIYMSGVYNSI